MTTPSHADMFLSGIGSARTDFLSIAAGAVTLSASESSSPDRWEITGLALPYGEELQRFDPQTGATRWMFSEGSADLAEGAQLFFDHDHSGAGMPIGRITSSEQTAEGLHITASVSKTDKGREVYTLLKDGVISKFSVGLDRAGSIERVENADTANPILIFDKITVWETSVVPNPAYPSAAIQSVLSKEIKMFEDEAGNTALKVAPSDLANLHAEIETLGRQVATLGAPSGEVDTRRSAPAASYGEFLQKVARNAPDALEFLAYVGGVTTDVNGFIKDAWVGDLYKLIENRRRVLGLFDRSPLPATGMGVEFGQVTATSNTITVGKQINEGDTLPYGKMAFATARAELETFGGWTELSRQVIERSGVAVVEKFFTELLNQYAIRTETRVRAEAIDPANAVSLGGTYDLDTSDGWIDYVADAAFWLDDKGLPIEFLLVGRDVFKSVAKLRDGENADAPRLLDRNSGTINLTGLTGEVFSIPVIPVNTGSDLGVVRACHSSAIRTFEAAGAPWRLQDDDITNLTKAFSIYGYMATAVQDTAAIVAPN